MQQGSQMKEQAGRIRSVHQEKFLLLSTASIPGNEGGFIQARVNVRGSMRFFSAHFWHSEGWTPRNEALLEAVLKRARITKHPWLVACDANMSPVD